MPVRVTSTIDRECNRCTLPVHRCPGPRNDPIGILFIYYTFVWMLLDLMWRLQIHISTSSQSFMLH
jgi:hypothetical protein